MIADHIALLLHGREVDTPVAFMNKRGSHAFFQPEKHAELVPGYYSLPYCDPDFVLEFYST